MPAVGRRPSGPVLLVWAALAAPLVACAGEGDEGRGGPGASGAEGDSALQADRTRPAGVETFEEPVTVVDAEGRTVTLSAPPHRIVSLVPSASRVLLALGAGRRLVARTEHDTLAALADLPSVGGGLHPSLEVLVALEPDLVIRFAGETDRETPARLDAAGVPHLAVAPESVADVREMIGALGRVVGRPGAAADLLASIDEALAEIRNRVEGRETVRVAWIMAGSPAWVAGPGTYIDELITLAGGENVFHDLGRRWAPASAEAVVARRPDLLLTARGNRLDPRVTRGVPVRTVSPVVQLPGPDLPRAAREIARALHPGLFR